MARAAVKAKQAQRAKPQPAKAAPRRGRRRHAGGGNPNQQLFFMRLRRQAKVAYVILAVLFAATFAFLGVGSGSSGLDQLFSNLNLFHHHGTSLSKALSEVKKRPQDPKAFRDLATAYESKGDSANSIDALQQYTTLRPKDAKAWSELAGLQLSQAQNLVTQYQGAAENQKLATPSQPLLPGGKLGQALGTNPIEKAVSNQASATTSDLLQRAQTGYSNAVQSYKEVAKLRPASADAQFQLAQAAQTAGDAATAVAAYKAYLKLNPDSSSAGQIRQLIKQLQPAPAKKAAPTKKTK